MDVQTETAEMKTDDSGVRLCYCFASPLVRQEGRDLFPVDLLNYMDEVRLNNLCGRIKPEVELRFPAFTQ